MEINDIDELNDLATYLNFLMYVDSDGYNTTCYWRFPPSGGETSIPIVPPLLEVDMEESYQYWVLRGDFDKIMSHLRSFPDDVLEVALRDSTHASGVKFRSVNDVLEEVQSLYDERVLWSQSREER